MKFQVLGMQLYLKKTAAQVFSYEFWKIWRKYFLENNSGQLVLNVMAFLEVHETPH